MAAQGTGVIERRVCQYIDMVNSAAMRHTAGDAHLAEDVTQAVFILLARRGTTIGDDRLAGWLFNTTRYVAKNAMRQEARRRVHERQAGLESIMHAAATKDQGDWEQIQFHLDEAVADLGKGERDVVLLHYFQRKSMSEAAVTLGLSEVAVRKRASRAVERMRKFYAGKGIVADSIGETIFSQAVISSPQRLVEAMENPSAITARAAKLVKSANRRSLMLKLKIAGVTVITALTAGVVVVQMTAIGDGPVSALPKTAPATAPAIPATQSAPATTAAMTKLLPPDLSDVVALRTEFTSNQPPFEAPITTWKDASSGSIETAQRIKFPGGDYLSIDIDGDVWRWREGSGVVGHHSGQRWIEGPFNDRDRLAQWVQTDLVREPPFDAVIDGTVCRAFREIEHPRRKPLVDTVTYCWADEKNRLRKVASHSGKWAQEQSYSYNPSDVKAAFTPPAIATIDLQGLLEREYPLKGAQTKNAEGLTVAVHQVKRDADGRWEVVVSVRRETPLGAANVSIGQYVTRLKGGIAIATLWDSAGVIYAVIPPGAEDAKNRCRFTIELAENAGIDSPVTPVEIDLESQGDQDIARFAGEAYDAANRLTPLVGGDGSGVLEEVHIDERSGRVAISPPLIEREKFVHSVVSLPQKPKEASSHP